MNAQQRLMIYFSNLYSYFLKVLMANVLASTFVMSPAQQREQYEHPIYSRARSLYLLNSVIQNSVGLYPYLVLPYPDFNICISLTSRCLTLTVLVNFLILIHPSINCSFYSFQCIVPTENFTQNALCKMKFLIRNILKRRYTQMVCQVFKQLFATKK